MERLLGDDAGPLSRLHAGGSVKVPSPFALYPVIGEHLAAIEAALPPARDAYFAVFEGLSVKQQLALQAAAERQGSQAWQNLKHGGLSPAHLAELDALTALELESAEQVEALVARLPD